MWCYTDLSLQDIHSRLAPGEPFSLLGYSFGGLLALELALELEAEGREGHLYLVDSAPVFMKVLVEQMVGSDEKKFATNLMCTIFKITAPHDATSAAISKVFPVRNVRCFNTGMSYVIFLLTYCIL
jgi:thioesterase domain-containing protein